MRFELIYPKGNKLSVKRKVVFFSPTFSFSKEKAVPGLRSTRLCHPGILNF